MNGQASLATGLRPTGINASLDELEKDLQRLDEVVSEIRQKTSPLRVQLPPEPIGTEYPNAMQVHQRREIDERIQNARQNIRGVIARIESTYEEIKL